MVGRAIVLGQPPVDSGSLAPTVIRHAELNPDVPIFVPVHPRIATTISFPRSIGEPLGTGFVDAENIGKASSSKTPPVAKGEYIIDYEQGDTFFTVQPTARSELLNLNVPFEGATIVFYFYPVQSPLSALASLILQDKPNAGVDRRLSERAGPQNSRPEASGGFEVTAGEAFSHAVHESMKSTEAKPVASVQTQENIKTNLSTGRIQKAETLPVTKFVPATPGRLDGFLRKLRMVHAAQRGAELDELAGALNVSVAISTAEVQSTTAIAHP
ncbi:MAG TPA: hypothetical protein VIM69_07000, partial [Opitutaceae bacterium]